MDLDIAFCAAETLEACHEELRGHFEPMIKETSFLKEVDVCAAITLRMVRLAKMIELSCRAGLVEESQIPLRSATESIVNLLYIMYVGPARGDGSTQGKLAQQFSAYADMAYYKMLYRRRDKARAAFKKHQGMSDADFDTFLQQQSSEATAAAELHGCTRRRWHSMDLQSMAEMVRDNAPAFVLPAIAETAFSSLVGANSATHGDALSLRTQYNALGNAPLEMVVTPNSINADVAAMEALWAWKTLADYFNQMEFVNKCWNKHLREVLKGRKTS